MLIVFFLGFIVFFCVLFWKVEIEEEFKEIGEEFDFLLGKKIYDFEIGQLVIVDEMLVEIMDMIKWKLVFVDSILLIQFGEGIVQEEVMGNFFKFIEWGDFGIEFYIFYNVMVLLFFFLDCFNLESNEIFCNFIWAFNYYGGMQMVLDEFDEQGVKLNVCVMDSKVQEVVVGWLFNMWFELYNFYLIIGLYWSDNVEMVVEFVCCNNKIYVLLYSVFVNIVMVNLNYIQVSFILQLYCQVIMKYVYENYGCKKIVLVLRDKEVEWAWFNYFQEEIFCFEGCIEDFFWLWEYVVEVDNNDEEWFGNIDLLFFMIFGDIIVFIVFLWFNEIFVYFFFSQVKFVKNFMNQE